MGKAKSTIHSRLHALNTAIREGVIVEANIKEINRPLIGIRSDTLGISLLFHDDENQLCLLEVNLQSPLEFIVKIPRDEISEPVEIRRGKQKTLPSALQRDSTGGSIIIGKKPPVYRVACPGFSEA